MAPIDPRHRQYLDAMGIQAWEARSGEAAGTAAPGLPSAAAELPGDSDSGPAPEISGLDLDALRARVATCTACALHASRTQTVFGTGAHDADWMIIGEAPGAEEDRQGEPFVGRAGILLNAMLEAAGFSRPEVYIANILKCRPPGNRDPKGEETECCSPFLYRQIDLVRPKLILCVGRVAAQWLLKTNAPLGRLRGRVHRLEGKDYPVIATYHPAYLLRQPRDKRKAWEDLKFALEVSGVRSS